MNEASSYNEGFDDTGRLRAPYRAFQARTGRDVFDPSPESVTRLTRRPLGDRLTILPIPLILDDREYRETISRGVRQRALALQSLFHDLICGESRAVREAPLPVGLLSQVLENEGISLRDLTRWWAGKDRELVRFTYAPDLVRDPSGRWLVLEDNLGCVGGVVDSHLVVERFLAFTGTSLDSEVPRGSDLAAAVCEFLARLGKTPESEGVLALLGHECSTVDAEAGRRRQVLEELGLRALSTVEMEEAATRGLRPDAVAAVINFDSQRLGARVRAHRRHVRQARRTIHDGPGRRGPREQGAAAIPG